MKKPKRKKPEFRVGQIIVLRVTGVPYKIGGVAGYCNRHGCFTYKLPEHQALAVWDEHDLRPLTAKEKNCRHRHAR